MSKTIRLIYPQWQGGVISNWIPELSEEDSSRGYFLGAQLLNMLASKNASQETFEVPISMDISKREIKNGIMDYDFILNQSKEALKILEKNNPDKIIVFGGECSVSVIPFTFLNKKYNNDIAIIWIDAHPDITLPNDSYAGYRAMALTACMGEGDKNIMSALPSKIDASKILLVGIRDWERDEIKLRQQKYGIKHLTPKEVSKNSDLIIKWLKECGASKVLIHFDLDVLEPKELIAAVGVVENGMKIKEVIRVINDIANEKEIVGLTIAEHIPRVEIMIKNILDRLPLIN